MALKPIKVKGKIFYNFVILSSIDVFLYGNNTTEWLPPCIPLIQPTLQQLSIDLNI